MAFLNCCRADEETDPLKAEDPDVPAKQRRVDPTPPKISPSEPAEKTTAVAEPVPAEALVLTEKSQPASTAVPEAQPPVLETRTSSRPSLARQEATQAKAVDSITPSPTTMGTVGTVGAVGAVSAAAATAITHQGHHTDSETLAHDQVTISPETNAAVQSALPPSDSPPLPHDSRNDVVMADVPAPPVEQQNVVDEPVQPHDVQPMPLPPPPPIQQRAAQVPAIAAATPPVPEIEPEKQQWLLPPAKPPLKGRKCLILDLDETLVHSSFKILNQADFTIPVEIEGQYHNVYVIKRPGVDQFMKRVGELFEVVVFTASVSKYGDPLLDQLDIHHVVHHRLFRESCYNHQGNYVKVCSRTGTWNTSS